MKIVTITYNTEYRTGLTYKCVCEGPDYAKEATRLFRGHCRTVCIGKATITDIQEPKD